MAQDLSDMEWRVEQLQESIGYYMQPIPFFQY